MAEKDVNEGKWKGTVETKSFWSEVADKMTGGDKKKALGEGAAAKAASIIEERKKKLKEVADEADK